MKISYVTSITSDERHVSFLHILGRNGAELELELELEIGNWKLFSMYFIKNKRK